jgi:hypothetical protein
MSLAEVTGFIDRKGQKLKTASRLVIAVTFPARQGRETEQPENNCLVNIRYLFCVRIKAKGTSMCQLKLAPFGCYLFNPGFSEDKINGLVSVW